MPKTSRQSIGGRRRYQPDADRFVDDLDQLRAELNLDRIAVLGHSSQGFIALRYARGIPITLRTQSLLAGFSPWMRALLTNRKHWAMIASQERKELLMRNRERGEGRLEQGDTR